MAQLNDLVVTGKSRFLNEINGKIDWSNINNKPSTFTPTIGTTASTAMAGNTNVNNVTQTASLTASTEYGVLLTSSASDSSNHTEGARKSLYLKYSEVPGRDDSTCGTLKVLSGETSARYGVKISQCDIELITEGYTYDWTWGGISSSLDTSIGTAKTTVKQSSSTTNANYEILFSNTADNTDRTETTKKSSTLLFNPAQKALTGGTRKANTTVGEYSFSVGISNTASGYCCQAFGNEVSATNNNTFAHGYQTVASHYCAHAEGWQTTASGQSSHAEGEGTIANHRNQHVFGRFNVADPSTAVADADGTYVEIVGNGGGSGSRSNARTLAWNGNETLAGSLQLGGGLCQLSNLGNIELKPGASNANHGGYIDFHYNQSTADYTARLIESGSSGTIKAYNSISNASDRRLKDNIVDIDNKYIYLLNELDAKQYNFKTSPDKVELGFIAQEVESAMKIVGIKDDEMPIISKPTDDELDKYYGLDYSQMTALLWKICQEQQKEINELKAQLNK